MKNRLYKIAISDLIRLKHPNELGSYGTGESNFKLENPTLDETIAKVKKVVFNGDKVISDAHERIIPDYIILENRSGKLYEILTDVLVVPYDDYFEGVGVFFKGAKAKVLTPISAKDLVDYKNDFGFDFPYIKKRLIKFASKANNAQYYLYNLDVEFRKYNDLDEQLGGEYLKKIFKK